MYNFGVPSTLKAYFDYIGRAGRDASATRERPGRAADRQEGVRVRRSRWRLCRRGERDRDELRAPGFSFLGITDIEFVYAEGLRAGRRGADRGVRVSYARAIEQLTDASRLRAREDGGEDNDDARTPTHDQRRPHRHGAGVKLRRSLGSVRWALPRSRSSCSDEFSSDEAADYIAGFPSHPHRGFETVTYMLDGHMRHEDHLGHRGELTSRRRAMDDRRPRHHPLGDARSRIAAACAASSCGSTCRGGEDEAGHVSRHRGTRDSGRRSFQVAARVKVIAGTITVAGREVAGPIQGLTTDPTLSRCRARTR